VRWLDVTGRSREVGQIEYMGTKPDGSVGWFTEDEARYIAGSQQQVVKRTVTITTETGEWEDA
jgi:hypothetical protein